MPGILGSETFKDPMNMLRYQFAYCTAVKGRGRGIGDLQTGPENPGGSHQSGDELLSPTVSFCKQILTIGGVCVPVAVPELVLCVITKLLLSSSPRADEIEMIMTDLERANQVGF